MSASQIPVRARAAGDRLPLSAAHQDRAAVQGQAGVRLAVVADVYACSSFVLAGITACVLWVAVAGLLRQRRPGNRALGRPGRARRSPSGGARCRDRDLRADMAGGASSGPGPRPRSGCVLPGLARHRGDPADDLAQCRGGGADRWSCAAGSSCDRRSTGPAGCSSPSRWWQWTEPTGWPTMPITGSVSCGAFTPFITARRS